MLRMCIFSNLNGHMPTCGKFAVIADTDEGQLWKTLHPSKWRCLWYNRLFLDTKTMLKVGQVLCTMWNLLLPNLVESSHIWLQWLPIKESQLSGFSLFSYLTIKDSYCCGALLFSPLNQDLGVCYIKQYQNILFYVKLYLFTCSSNQN